MNKDLLQDDDDSIFALYEDDASPFLIILLWDSQYKNAAKCTI